MNVVIAPDSFKGSLSSELFCECVRHHWLAIRPKDRIKQFPLADGGEGTAAVIGQFLRAHPINVETVDPMGRPLSAEFYMQDTMAMIDFASASGLTLLTPEEYNPDFASSFGTGLMIRAALDRNATHIVLGLGGSATNDAALGLLDALGARFYEASGARIASGGLGLAELFRIDLSGLDPRLKTTRLTLVTDVTNPLLGANGATQIFGPQKLAPDSDVPTRIAALDKAMVNAARVLTAFCGVDMDMFRGAGAAGGAGASLQALLKAEYRSGIQYVLEQYQFESELSDADLVITGEGRLDNQSLQGKVISGVLEVTGRRAVPTIALVGSMSRELDELYQRGLSAAFSISNTPMTLPDAQKYAQENLAQLVTNLARSFQINIR